MEEHTLDTTQLDAVELCCDKSKRVAAVTGPAGTGKTTILRQAYERLSSKGWMCAMVAPTGKAARRITQATGIQARTIHKLLEYPSPGEVDEDTGKALEQGYPSRNRTKPLDCNCLFIDEASMVTTTLARQIYEAMPSGGIVRMFGDMNQLPPIEDTDEDPPFWHALYKRSNVGPPKELGVRLSTIYRQGEGSGIIENGVKITKGMHPRQFDDFKLIPTKNHIDSLLSRITDNYATLDNQVICPGKKGFTGTVALNAILQKRFNPSYIDGVEVDRHSWDKRESKFYIAINDKVTITKNWYDLGQYGLMNGEVGIVVDITPYGELVIDFGTEVASIPTEVSFEYKGKECVANPQKDIDLAYAITTHKSQGNEFNEVFYIISKDHRALLYRNNFYTAVTRARKSVSVIYDTSCMSRALSTVPLIDKKNKKSTKLL